MLGLLYWAETLKLWRTRIIFYIGLVISLASGGFNVNKRGQFRNSCFEILIVFCVLLGPSNCLNKSLFLFNSLLSFDLNKLIFLFIFLYFIDLLFDASVSGYVDLIFWGKLFNLLNGDLFVKLWIFIIWNTF